RPEEAMMRTLVMLLLPALCTAVGAQGKPVPSDPQPAPIDFAKLERRIAKLPALGPAPRYGPYLFRVEAPTRARARLGQSDPKRGMYDLLYLDRNANGDLTEPGERFVGKKTRYANEDACEFAIGEFAPQGGGAAHKDFVITWTQSFGVRFKMLWHGEKTT